MKIRPIGDRIVIKVIEDAAQTEGGIFIPDSAKEVITAMYGSFDKSLKLKIESSVNRAKKQ